MYPKQKTIFVMIKKQKSPGAPTPRDLTGDDIEFSAKTPGLIEKCIQVYERVFKENINPADLKDEINQLKIKDPTDIPQV